MPHLGISPRSGIPAWSMLRCPAGASVCTSPFKFRQCLGLFLNANRRNFLRSSEVSSLPAVNGAHLIARFPHGTLRGRFNHPTYLSGERIWTVWGRFSYLTDFMRSGYWSSDEWLRQGCSASICPGRKPSSVLVNAVWFCLPWKRPSSPLESTLWGGLWGLV